MLILLILLAFCLRWMRGQVREADIALGRAEETLTASEGILREAERIVKEVLPGDSE
jgi:hypothetical protein